MEASVGALLELDRVPLASMYLLFAMLWRNTAASKNSDSPIHVLPNCKGGTNLAKGV